ncbi:cation transport protein ChaC [Enterobacter sp. BIGb0383]|uniref:gamma-glutamylcyclotransferase n=1 Tax=unclassified Enterobacter TaxID=2608935 RepID=UPI000F480F08|nr:MULTISPECIES: gamma-glutamylcyclotransferase [unclassified Enterobacter]ROP61710.1 cation transport protein ChaC [Enterobacter sp. BIGb0383]ROS11871.1 cation transport protein ChaC [Enterobacter sp. BIGb0359]
MLTRENMRNGTFVRAHETLLPAHMRWDAEKIRASMYSTLEERPTGAPVWVFAYGSLMWNPALAIEEMQRACLKGWQRSFCIRLISGRATPDVPGRMLSLDEGGITEGMAFRLPESTLIHELEMVWTREMITGLYRPVWADVSLGSGEEIQALAFVSDRLHTHYEKDNLTATVAARIASAWGDIGTNADYVWKLQATLGAWGIQDDYVSELALALHEASCIDKLHQQGAPL